MKHLLVLFVSLFFAVNGYAYQHDVQSCSIANHNHKNTSMCCDGKNNNNVQHSCNHCNNNCDTCSYCNKSSLKDIKSSEHKCNHKHDSNIKDCCHNKSCSMDKHRQANIIYIDKKYLELQSKKLN